MVLPDFKDHENYNAVSSFTVLRHVPWNNFIYSAAQYDFLWFLFSDAAGNEHCLLVEIPVKRSTFNSNIQKQAFQDHYN